MRTIEDVKAAIGGPELRQWVVRECGFCHYPLSYVFQGGNVYFDPGCDCTNRNFGLEERTYEEIARSFNMQSDPQIAERMWNEFVEAVR